jgi:TRAP-type C4-dicarboxylate transport system permease small subunit
MDAVDESTTEAPRYRLSGWAAPLSHVADALQGFITILVGLGMATLCAAVLIQVGGRYLFRYSPVWSEVLAGYIVVWISFLGAAWLIRSGMHLSVSLLPDALRRGPRLAGDLAAVGASILFSVVALWAGLQQHELTVPMMSLGLDISASWLYLAVPVYAACALIFLAEQLAATIQRALQGEAS